jgi:hypothetical protein
MSVKTNAPYARQTEDVDPRTLQGRLSNWELTPNMRVGTFSHYRDNNQRAYATLDGSCICHHGEVAGTIRAWTFHEKKTSSLVRWSTCTCTSTQGLTRKVKQEDLPPEPNSYYELLQEMEAECLEMSGTGDAVVALATPLRCESGPVFLADDGRFFCGHGSEFIVKALPTARKQARVKPTETPIRKPQRTIRRRFHTKTCQCRLVLPNRTTFPELPFVSERRGD